MITDRKASMMFSMLNNGHSVASISRELEMGQRTVRTYRAAAKLNTVEIDISHSPLLLYEPLFW